MTEPINESLIEELLINCVDLFRQAYKNTGAPLGDNEEGFILWLKVLADLIPDYTGGNKALLSAGTVSHLTAAAKCTQEERFNELRPIERPAGRGAGNPTIAALDDGCF